MNDPVHKPAHCDCKRPAFGVMEVNNLVDMIHSVCGKPVDKFVWTNGMKDHLERLKARYSTMQTAKYFQGAKKHGGTLMDMTPTQLVLESLAENIDQGFYLLTLLEKLEGCPPDHMIGDRCIHPMCNNGD